MTLLRFNRVRHLPVPPPDKKDTSVCEDIHGDAMGVILKSLDIELEGQQTLFLKATQRRQKVAEGSMERWKQIYSINELERQERFKNIQHSHSKAFTSMCQQHASEFVESQQQREKEFDVNEQRREREFIRDVKTMEILFKEAHNSMEERFSQVMEDHLSTARWNGRRYSRAWGCLCRHSLGRC